MRLGAAFLLASRSLLGRRAGGGEGGRNYLRGAVTGVALALVPLLVVMVVADGMIEGITARYLETSTYHLQAWPYLRRDAPSLLAAARKLSATEGVLAAWAETQGPAIAIARGRTSGALARGIEPGLLRDPGFARYLELREGELRLSGANDILLGEALARSLGARPGDIVSLASTRGGGSFSPRVSAWRVRGIVSSGYRELDATWAFVPLASLARVADPDSSRAFVGIKVAEPLGSLVAVKAALEATLATLGEESRGFEWSLLDWKEAERNLFQSFATTRALLLLVMALAVAVAAINVGSALVMLVLERRRDIAILKSSGASPAALAAVFLIAGAATGGAGTLLGLGLGSLLAWRVNDLIAAIESLSGAVARLAALLRGRPLPEAIRLLDPGYYLERIPVRLDPGELALVGGLSLLLCLLASLLPALRAARLSPLEILRRA